MASAAPNGPSAPLAPSGDAADLPPALRDFIDAVTAGRPRTSPGVRGERRPRPVRPVAGGCTIGPQAIGPQAIGPQAIGPLAPLNLRPLTAAGGSAPPRPRFLSVADLAVVLVWLAAVVAVLAGLDSLERPQRSVDGSCTVTAGEAAGRPLRGGCPALPRRG